MPRFPDQPIPHGAITPMVYVRDRTVWEYKQIVRNLAQDTIPTEEQLNRLGKEGWELVNILANAGVLYLYFKRMKD